MLSLIIYVAFILALAHFSESLPLEGRASGCNTNSPWTFDSSGHRNQTLGDRTYLVHIPTNYNPSMPHPLVLNYHGRHGEDILQEKLSGFANAGDEYKINGTSPIVVSPMGEFGPAKGGTTYERAWQGAPYAKPGVDDVAFTHSIIDEVEANLCVDPTRIYATGKSNGGGLCNLLACTRSSAARIAAFALVSAALYPGTKSFEGCDPGRPIPLLDYHGLADQTIPFGGQTTKGWDTAYATPNITEFREAWAKRNGCSSTVPTNITHPHTDTTLKEWGCSTTNPDAAVKGYTVRGLGHSWPTTARLDNGVTSFDATPADIIPFFSTHVLRT